MEKSKQNAKILSVIYILLSVIWGIVCIMDFIKKEVSELSFVAHIVCFAAFTFCAVTWLIQYRKTKDNIQKSQEEI